MHPTKLITFENKQANIDEDIADLILNLWKIGINTKQSCQRCQDACEGLSMWGDFVQIIFPTSEDALKFMRIACAIYSVRKTTEETNAFNPPKLSSEPILPKDKNDYRWRYIVRPQVGNDLSVIFLTWVYFHRSDLGNVCANVEEYVEFLKKKVGYNNE